MTLAVMQPYLFPYIGYFQLINAANTFVIYDDVNYIKQGWINRNRILLNDKDFMFNLILSGASSFKLINEVEVAANQQKLNKTIFQAYCKAPYFEQVYPIIDEIINNNEKNLAKYLTFSLLKIIDYLKIGTKILISSELEKNIDLKGEDKVIDICLKLKATNYINAIGGQSLYSKEKFFSSGITLNFIKSQSINYKQFNNEFIPWLSIIDVIMFNNIQEIKFMLDNYVLL